MNTPQPVVMPQSPGGLNWNLGVPDLGGSAYTNMANSLSKSMMEGTNKLGDNLKASAGTSQLLQVLGQAKNKDGSPMLDPSMVADLSTKGLPAQQKGIGMMMSSVMAQQQAQNAQNAQMNMLNAYQQNPNALRTKIQVEAPRGQQPVYQQPQQPAEQTTAQTAAQTAPKVQPPSFMPPPGVDMTTEQHNGNTVYAFRRPGNGNQLGPIIHAVNPDGTPYTGGQ